MCPTIQWYPCVLLLIKPTRHPPCCRCRKIGGAGSQQLLLDTQAIKGLLLDLPAAGAFALPSPTCTHCLVVF